MRFELYMHQKGLLPKHAFRALEADRDAIERELGLKLDWQEIPDKVASRIATYLGDASIEYRTDWARQHQWILGQLRAFRRVFGPRIKVLDLEGSDEAEDGEP